MTFWKKLRQDFEESQSPGDDDFLGWFLRRKLSFWGKMAVVSTLWLIWIYLYLNIHLYVYVFWGLVILALGTGIWWLLKKLKK